MNKLEDLIIFVNDLKANEHSALRKWKKIETLKKNANYLLNILARQFGKKKELKKNDKIKRIHYIRK